MKMTKRCGISSSRRQSSKFFALFVCLASCLVSSPLILLAGESPATAAVQWDKVLRVSKTSVSIQDCPEPPLRRGRPTHDPIYKALRDLNADYPRLQPWFCYPKMTVAELKPPESDKTYWDFSLMDEYTEDFIQATAGHPVVFDFGTLPAWMFKTQAPVRYPEDPDEIDWNYEKGTELRDPTMKEVADYQARLVRWYTQGGFDDELGNWHDSGHHYKIDYWEVLNEIDSEHSMSPEFYTRLYDAVIEQMRQVSPHMKFIGLALTNPIGSPQYFQYFLDPRNHKPGIPIDMISYHFYTMPEADETPETMQYTIFDQADKFLTAVRYIESIRKRLSPATGTYIDELGSMLPDPQAPQLAHPIPDSYWNLAGAMWAYTFVRLATMGIDAVGGAELVDYPGQFAATSLLNWDTGQPNARYRVLKLLHDNFTPLDKLVETHLKSPSVFAQAFVTSQGGRKILLVNKRDRQIEVSVPGSAGGTAEIVDQTTGSSPPAMTSLTTNDISLNGLAVAVVILKKQAD
jgi:hypothetical protein